MWADKDAAKWQKSQTSEAAAAAQRAQNEAEKEAEMAVVEAEPEPIEEEEEEEKEGEDSEPKEYHSPMIACDSCGRWVHNACTKLAASELQV